MAENVNESRKMPGDAELGTEGWRRELADLDKWPLHAAVEIWIESQNRVTAAVEAATPSIAKAVGLITWQLQHGGRLIYVGAGTSGQIAALEAQECAPTFNVDTVLAITAGAGLNAADRHAAEDTDGAASMRVQKVNAADVVVGVTASGQTPFVLGALAYAKDVGASTIGVSNNPDTPLAAGVDISVELLTGPEILAGSTRLNAGTAQKIVLNMFSTLSLIKTGHTYGNLMIDVRADNAKLRARQREILIQATGVEGAVAEHALVRAGDARTALVALKLGVDVSHARKLLSTQNLRAALGER